MCFLFFLNIYARLIFTPNIAKKQKRGASPISIIRLSQNNKHFLNHNSQNGEFFIRFREGYPDWNGINIIRQ